jgi:DNA-binding transcriptional LysR family regulator
MQFADIDYLASVAEHRNIGRAAEAVGLTQPALSRAIARLEALAGQPLFTRHPKGVELTPAGDALLKHALRIRIEYGDAMRELQQMKTGQLGLLRVGYSPSVDEDIVIAATRQLVIERPAARLKLTQSPLQDLLEQLVRGELDVIFGPVPVPMPREVVASVHYRSSVRVFADRKHPLFGRERVYLRDLAREPWLLPPPHVRVRHLLEERMAELGLAPLNVRVESDSLSPTQLRLLCGTRMVAVFSEWWGPFVRRFGVEPLPVADLAVYREIASMRRTEGYVSPLSTRLEELFHAGIKPAHTQPIAAPLR